MPDRVDAEPNPIHELRAHLTQALAELDRLSDQLEPDLQSPEVRKSAGQPDGGPRGSEE
ncbi:MAG: hypothetical protein L0H74_05975 [Brachybacterium sp.]|nr:hypothetical protein [Brachybacterium sp.]